MKFADFRGFWITVERCGTEEPIRPFGALNETLKRSFEGKCSVIQPSHCPSINRIMLRV